MRAMHGVETLIVVINDVVATNGWFFNVCSFVNRNKKTSYQVLQTKTVEPSGFHSIGSRYYFQKNGFSHCYNFKHIQDDNFNSFL